MGLLDPANWAAKFGSDAPVTTGLLAPYPTQPANGLLAPYSEMRSYQPSPHEMVQGWLTRLLGGGREASQQSDQVMSLIDLTPAGAPLAGYDAGRRLGGGLYRGSPADTARGLLDLAGAGVQAAPIGLLRLDNALGRLAEPVEQAAAKSVSRYDPPVMPPRPFEADYPNGAAADEQRNLTRDIEGRPLAAPYIAGRRVVGGSDEAVSDLDAIATASTGRVPVVLPPGQMGPDFGRTVLSKYTRQPQEIQLRSDLAPDKRPLVLAHEVSHAIDEIAGQVDTSGLMNELKSNYNILNNSNRLRGDPSQPANWGKPTTPQALGYKGDDVKREYMAEAIRAYLANPNYLKTAAPKTATAIRDAVNSNPQLMKIIQFNGLAGLLATGAARQSDSNE